MLIGLIWLFLAIYAVPMTDLRNPSDLILETHQT